MNDPDGVRGIVATGRRWGCLLLLAAAVFRLWDGQTLIATGWVQHGDEYVVTLRDGTTVILRQQEVRELDPAGDDGAPVRGR